MANVFKSVLAAAAALLQSKTVTAGTTDITVTPDTGYDGLSSVTVEPTPSEAKSQAAGTSNVTVTPTAGKLLSSVTIQPTPSESKSATPSTTAQTITPSTGKLLSSVSVGAIQIDSTNNTATPTTSAQTVNPASGKYFNTFSVGAIPSEYIIPSGNKAITANGTGIDVKSYATASVSVSGTSITPSNSSPASMTSGTLYTPSANGYAISSYSSTTPSNSSPVSLSSGSIYKMGGAGKAVASVTDITPSNTSPASVSSGGIYKASAAGYAISSYSSSSLTPSTSGQYFSSGWNRMTSSGYAYSSKPTSQVKVGTAGNTSATIRIECGFTPKHICAIVTNTSGNNANISIYNVDTSTGTSKILYGSNSAYVQQVSIPNTGTNRINSVDSTGFTLGKNSSASFPTYHYFAVGDI